MDAIPAGMELFAAGNTDQWTLIQQVIDQSDYYIVIVGGRYGSVTAEGVSYTEKEYDYAIDQEIPVMGFVHSDPNAIPAGKSELDPDARARLDAFRAKVKQKIVREYGSPSELGGVVSRGLHKLQRDFPRPGWVRGDLAMTPATETRIAEMRAELAELRQAAAERTDAHELPRIEGLASGSDRFELTMRLVGTSKDESGPDYAKTKYLWAVGYVTTWDEILETVGPSLMDEAPQHELSGALEQFGMALARSQQDLRPTDLDRLDRMEILPSSVDDVVVQLFALGLIAHGVKKRTNSDTNRYWMLTTAGRDRMMQLRAKRRPTHDELVAQRREYLTSMTVAELRTLSRELSGESPPGRKSELIDLVLKAELPSDRGDHPAP